MAMCQLLVTSGDKVAQTIQHITRWLPKKNHVCDNVSKTIIACDKVATTLIAYE